MEVKTEEEVLTPVRRSERRRVKEANILEKRATESAHKILESNCIVCYAVFNPTTAFSRKNNLSPSVCSNVFALFTRFLVVGNQADDYTYQIRWDWKNNPLPFCASCSSSLLGWTKLQEQCEELQATLAELRESVIEKIVKSSAGTTRTVSEDKDLLESLDYNNNIELMRRQVLRGCNLSVHSASEQNDEIKTQQPMEIDEEIQPADRQEPEFIMGDVDVYSEWQDTAGEEGQDHVNSDASNVSSSDEDFVAPLSPLGKQTQEKESNEDCKSKTKKLRYVKKKSRAKNQEDSDEEFTPEQNTKVRRPKLKITTSEDGRKFYGENEFTEIVEDGCTRYKCLTCGSVQKTLTIFKRHVQHLHIKTEPFECFHCGKVLQNIGSKSRHMKIYHSSIPRILLQCELCGKKVTSQRGMIIHKGLIHREGLDKFHLCDICSRPFHNIKEMKTHRWTHKSEEEKMAEMNKDPSGSGFPKNHICHQCGKVLSSDANLRSHELIHSSEKPFVCEVCGWAFRHKANLIKHLEIHEDGDEMLKFVCREDGCGKKYRFRTQLRNHSFSHKSVTEKPHKCAHCDAYFVRAFDLTVHNRIHTQEKPYQCQSCGKYFSRQHHWTRHMKNVHHIENPGRPTKGQADTIVTYIEDFSYSLLTTESVSQAE